MSKSETSINTTGVFNSLLAVLFIGLKLTGHIDWSWLWVLAPLWLPTVLVLGFLGVVFTVKMVTKDSNKKEKKHFYY